MHHVTTSSFSCLPLHLLTNRHNEAGVVIQEPSKLIETAIEQFSLLSCCIYFKSKKLLSHMRVTDLGGRAIYYVNNLQTAVHSDGVLRSSA